MEFSNNSDWNFSDVKNLTNVTFNDESLMAYETVIASFLTVSTVFSWISNLSIIVVFLKFSCLRTKHDVLVINLAFTNLTITTGIAFYSTYTLNPGNIFHMKFVCMSLFMLIFGGILTSLLVLFCLALERYLCIVHPLIYSRIRNRHVVMSSILAYIIGIIYIVLPFNFKNKWERYHLCVVDVFPFEFSIAEQVIGVIIISAIIVINSVVFKTALSQAARIKTLLKNIQHKHTKKRKRQKGKAFVTVFLLSGISAICWIPLLVVFGLESDPDLNEAYRWILTQLLYVPVSLNSSVTAVIIGYRNRHFRDAIKSFFCKRQHECSGVNRINVTIYV
ncbi:unnamed protein product [Mytilus coruscus]|uniref:G-protein coupled receptors family 1 profile domain-containing protein n=1 Tax=Mytilus coruscus TaxID=42192 RepID=A0A6J8DQE0_MYTCO|nr:unnamed protein product [Mytilus coruscus]